MLAGTAHDLHTRDIIALVEEMEELAGQQFRFSVGPAELDSWRHSIPTVLEVLVSAGLGQVMVLLEMSTLSSDARIDMLLVGSHPSSANELSLVAIENKQWSHAGVNPRTNLIAHPGARHDGSQHPAKQVWNYCRALERNLPMLGGRFHAVVNLHNANTEDIAAILPPRYPFPAEVRERVRTYGKDKHARIEFAQFLSQVLSPENAHEHARDINHAHVRPTESLMRAVARAVADREMYVLLDEQQETADRVIRAVDQALTEDNKQVFIINGGPGTGKSVLALELLGRLSRLGCPTVHASGSSAFGVNLREHVVGQRGSINEIFTYFHHHRNRKPNDLNVLIIDEAHRLRKDSNVRFTKAEFRSNTPQVWELIRAARVPVFLLDPHQVVARNEVGAPELIRQAALDRGVAPDNIHEITLGRQFRHSTCPGYVDWIEDLLGYGPAPRPWRSGGEFRLLLADSPQQMEDYLRAKIALGYTARMVAGFCWKWTKEPLAGGWLATDIEIGTWKRPWNANKGNVKLNIPSRNMWPTDPSGFEQIGCIYTAQNFDWDHAGVIMGPDYTWRNDRWTSIRNFDIWTQSRRRHQLIRNIYRVLATRGKLGTVLYSTDDETQGKLASLGIPPVQPILADILRRHPHVANSIAHSKEPPPIQETIF
ncbi:DUF2075 domain-containing protein [Spirillospora sp. CA-128828]|uniref:DUF2075 domain-containing protein n=1 Tax=Spirillospora sp. CA-128828 TaxID=3240033 RepID=UPI003D93F2DF